jgi:hypothetical protein
MSGCWQKIGVVGTGAGGAAMAEVRLLDSVGCQS